MKWSELGAQAKIDLLAQLLGYEKLRIGYAGVHTFTGQESICNETLRQVELVEWLDKVGLDQVGVFYIDVKTDTWMYAADFQPLSMWNDTMLVLTKIRDSGLAVSLLAPEHINQCAVGIFDVSAQSASVAEVMMNLQKYALWPGTPEEAVKYGVSASVIVQGPDLADTICRAACIALHFVEE